LKYGSIAIFKARIKVFLHATVFKEVATLVFFKMINGIQVDRKEVCDIIIEKCKMGFYPFFTERNF
ncbi:MAG: hypothetical protein WB502_11090, partial [Thermoactinomyces sp.]